MLSVTGSIAAGSGPVASVDATLQNVTAGQTVYVGAGASHNGIDSLTASQTAANKITVNVIFKAPDKLLPNSYHDTVRIAVCSDQQCNNVIAEQDATADYTVTSPNLELVLNPTTLQVSANPSDVDPPVAQTVDVSFSQPLNVDYFAMNVVNQTHQALLSVAASSGSNGGQLTIQVQAPGELLPGTYTDTVTVQGCYDPDCLNLMGEPRTLTVIYTIPNSVAGAQGYSVAVYPLLANDLIWDAVHKVIYLSVPSAAGASGNTIAAIDPTNGTVLASSPAGSEPGTLALSDDAQFLYVAMRGTNTIQRFVLPALTPDITIQLPSDPFFGPMYANDLKVMPGAPHTLAVARSISAIPDGAGVAIFDDAVPRANTTTGPGLGQSVNSIEWAGSASTLLAADSLPANGTDQNIYSLSVTASGVSITGQTQNGAGQGRMYYLGGLVYDDSGAIADPTILTGNAVIATCTPVYTELPFGAIAETIDVSQKKVFQLAAYGKAVRLLSYQTGTCTGIAEIGFGGVSLDVYHVPRLIRWGTNGVAFLTEDGKLITVTGAFVAP